MLQSGEDGQRGEHADESGQLQPSCVSLAGPIEDPVPECENLAAGGSRGSGQEEVPEEKCEVPLCTEQSERVLEQMRRCVLVHHQLGCLLIHNASLRAGLYSCENSNARVSAPGALQAAGDGRSEELEESIQNLGGSTARLFSMALRDRHDLESMEDTLQLKVADMVQNMRFEYERANCNAENSPLTTTAMFAALGAKDNECSEPGAHAVQQDEGSADAEEIANTDAEIEAATHECQQLAAELAGRQLQVARLREELRLSRDSSEDFLRRETIACADKVQAATDRNAELHDLLLQLLAVPLDGRIPYDSDEVAPAEMGADYAVNAPMNSWELLSSEQYDHEDSRPNSSRLVHGGQNDIDLGSTAAFDADSEKHMPDHDQRRGPMDPGSEVGLETPPLANVASAPASTNAWRRQLPRQELRGSGAPCILASPESLAQLDMQLRTSQSEFWGM